MKTNPRRISRKKLHSLISIPAQLNNLLDSNSVDGIAVFEDLEVRPDAQRPTGLAYGPGCTYKTLTEIKNEHLGDVPLCMRYCTMYYNKHMGKPVWHISTIRNNNDEHFIVVDRDNYPKLQRYYRFTLDRFDRIFDIRGCSCSGIGGYTFDNS